MNHYETSLVLIGMPGAGKSTIGLLLAKTLAKDFLDTDLIIQLQQGKNLQTIVDTDGYLALRKIEENILLSVNAPNHIIATGGSAVYSDAVMHHLKSFGPIVFLDVNLAELNKRINNFDTRGIARAPNQSFEDLFEERRALYLKYADIQINCSGKTKENIIDEIVGIESENYRGEDA